MNRRGFLRVLGLGAAAIAVDPEQLLWTPGQKTFFLPSLVTPPRALDLATLDDAIAIVARRGNQLVTPEWITREALQVLRKQLTVMQRIDRDWSGSPAVGFTVEMKLPKRFGEPVILQRGEQAITIRRRL